MKLVHVSSTADRVGGTQTYMIELARAQSERGDDVAIAHRGTSGELPSGIAELHAGRWESLAGALQEHAPDLVHVHGVPLPPPVDADLQARFAVVRSLHDFAFGCASGGHWFRDGSACERAHGAGCIGGVALRGCAHRLDLRPALRAYADVGRRLPTLRDARALVVYSEYMRGVALRNGIPAERCRAIPYFTERVQQRPHPPAGGRDVVFAGRLSAAKGLDVLLRALATRPGEWDRLLVLGDGWDRARCERLAQRLGIAPRVVFLGWRADGIGDVLRDARLLVVPSRWPEPFGIVGIEAMAAGRPVVASDVGGIREWLDDGETGLLVRPGDVGALADAVARLLADEELAARLGARGWERVGRFSCADHLARLDEAYRLALAA